MNFKDFLFQYKIGKDIYQEEVESQSFVVGRSSGSDIKIDLEIISRKHLQVFFENECIKIEDLGSTNGTFLNGTKIKPHKEYEYKINDKLLVKGAGLRCNFEIKKLFQEEAVSPEEAALPQEEAVSPSQEEAVSPSQEEVVSPPLEEAISYPSIDKLEFSEISFNESEFESQLKPEMENVQLQEKLSLEDVSDSSLEMGFPSGKEVDEDNSISGIREKDSIENLKKKIIQQQSENELDKIREEYKESPDLEFSHLKTEARLGAKEEAHCSCQRGPGEGREYNQSGRRGGREYNRRGQRESEP